MFGPEGGLENTTKGIYGSGSLVIQDTCKQCPHPVPCATACPQNAIIAQKGTGTRMVLKDRCVGCRLCQKACPWGVMTFDEEQGKADKCFLCNGAPKCVDACPAAALRYVPWSDRTREATTRGSFSLMVPDDRRAACNACHGADAAQQSAFASGRREGKRNCRAGCPGPAAKPACPAGRTAERQACPFGHSVASGRSGEGCAAVCRRVRSRACVFCHSVAAAGQKSRRKARPGSQRCCGQGAAACCNAASCPRRSASR